MHIGEVFAAGLGIFLEVFSLSVCTLGVYFQKNGENHKISLCKREKMGYNKG